MVDSDKQDLSVDWKEIEENPNFVMPGSNRPMITENNRYPCEICENMDENDKSFWYHCHEGYDGGSHVCFKCAVKDLDNVMISDVTHWFPDSRCQFTESEKNHTLLHLLDIQLRLVKTLITTGVPFTLGGKKYSMMHEDGHNIKG